MRRKEWLCRGSGSWVCTRGNFALAIYRGYAYQSYSLSRVDSDPETWKRAQAVPALAAALKQSYVSLRSAKLAVETILNSI
ncbi:hypothetical protein [uncultured Parasutterella sp.]|uniref:hypothetical protein n=1 Tax=uncultured Parasutterella sp. TaxID=1263098 RepID=UPI0025953FDE|nr:hypothetical protein [uncultured Parasutterella sp.]